MLVITRDIHAESISSYSDHLISIKLVDAVI